MNRWHFLTGLSGLGTAFLAVLVVWTLAYADTGSLTWHDNSANEDGFIIRRGLNGSPLQEIARVGPNITSYADNTLVQTTVDNVYCYDVAPFNKGGVAPFTPQNVDSCKTIAKLILPPAPASNVVVK